MPEHLRPIIAPAVVLPLAAKTANYTMLATDSLTLANAAITVTLPSAVTLGAGRQCTVKNIHATASVTVNTVAGSIDGVGSITLNPKDAVTVVSDGTDWWLI